MRRARTGTTPVGLVVALVTGLALAGCAKLGGPDDETAPAPRRTVTVSPSPVAPTPAARLPSRIPATPSTGGSGPQPTDVVWAQDGVLHVGTRAWDLAPRGVDHLVVVRGAVFFLDSGRLWVTDTVRVRDTGVGSDGTAGAAGAASDLAADAAGETVRVRVGGREVAYSVGTGRRLPTSAAASLEPVRPGDPGPLPDLPGADGLTGLGGDRLQVARRDPGGALQGLVLGRTSPVAVVACTPAPTRCRVVGRPTGTGPVLLPGA